MTDFVLVVTADPTGGRSPVVPATTVVAAVAAGAREIVGVGVDIAPAFAATTAAGVPIRHLARPRRAAPLGGAAATVRAVLDLDARGTAVVLTAGADLPDDLDRRIRAHRAGGPLATVVTAAGSGAAGLAVVDLDRLGGLLRHGALRDHVDDTWTWEGAMTRWLRRNGLPVATVHPGPVATRRAA